MEIHCSLNISTYKPIYAFLRGLRPQLHQRQFVLLLGCLLKGLNNCVNATPLWPHCGRSISSQPSFTSRNTKKTVHLYITLKKNPHTTSSLICNIRQKLILCQQFQHGYSYNSGIILHMHNNIDLCGTPCLGGQLYDVFNQSLNYETVNNKIFFKSHSDSMCSTDLKCVRTAPGAFVSPGFH